MQEYSLPSPGIGGKSHHLRRIAANAISYIESNAPNYASGKHPSAKDLSDFFTACATAIASYVNVADAGKGDN
ncbi:hypothetical protein CPT_Percy51 [Caulobacter phage Percy]|uniref:Uncharacterized protein n=1 Tax=Caulobacter phage Percy TaxID=1701809 RepID=A0A0M4RBW2_9CAUD|nr:hypothetical protein CPT_Percy51 [Caulobacter phage Percy]ALF01685.1 hypothetical protein CPT_Percy51 [Caulobacter phage Percy]